MTPLKSCLVWLAALCGAAAVAAQDAREELPGPSFVLEEIDPLPGNVYGYALGRSGNSVLVAGGIDPAAGPRQNILRLDPGGRSWIWAGDLPAPLAHAAVASSDSGMVIAGGERDGILSTAVLKVTLDGDTAGVSSLPDLPLPVHQPVAAIARGFLYVAGQASGQDGEKSPVFLRFPYEQPLSFLQRLMAGIGFRFTRTAAAWQQLDPWPGDALEAPAMAHSFETLHLFGVSQHGRVAGFGYRDGVWRPLAPPPGWDPAAAVSTLGESHIFFFEGAGLAQGASPRILAYHTLTDAWVEAGAWAGTARAGARAVTVGETIHVTSASGGSRITVTPPQNNYGWVDHTVVIIYLLGMVGMGAWFVRREKDTRDFFRAGNKVPWWAIGMSLFATGASAISLMTMPGKSYSGNWTFFAISIYSVMCLPLSLFLLAPLIRKLNIATANEYLELRFGLTARMVGSVIYMVNQVLGRMAPIIFLPSIAMSAITGVDIWVWILAIGSVTTLYTFMGGLSAVIWTDTIQGLIMLATVAGCLVLILFKVDIPIAEVWTILQDNEKLHMFDWGWDITQPMVIMVLTGTVFITLTGIGDQNYVQRVQAAPTLRDAKKAVATQMAVAIPINVLLFGLGTALYLYYRTHPAELNPVMKTDGVYPLFAAQHLPVGVSGLVIAALLAASMSTISSAICSVANLGVDDFYRRFKRGVDERAALLIARILSIAVGVLGIVGAFFLSKSDSKSVWDAALIITGLITNGTVGLFGLGLLTRRAHELGALLGLVAGMLVTIYLEAFTPVTFWLYAAAGSLVTFVTGYVLSLVLPCPRKPLDGLTVYTLDKPRRSL